MDNRLKVVYEGGLDTDLDKSIEKLLVKKGWEFLGSGFNFRTGKRDLVFTD